MSSEEVSIIIPEETLLELKDTTDVLTSTAAVIRAIRFTLLHDRNSVQKALKIRK